MSVQPSCFSPPGDEFSSVGLPTADGRVVYCHLPSSWLQRTGSPDNPIYWVNTPIRCDSYGEKMICGDRALVSLPVEADNGSHAEWVLLADFMREGDDNEIGSFRFMAPDAARLFQSLGFVVGPDLVDGLHHPDGEVVVRARSLDEAATALLARARSLIMECGEGLSTREGSDGVVCSRPADVVDR